VIQLSPIHNTIEPGLQAVYSNLYRFFWEYMADGYCVMTKGEGGVG